MLSRLLLPPAEKDSPLFSVDYRGNLRLYLRIYVHNATLALLCV